jgi:hypothetical protein
MFPHSPSPPPPLPKRDGLGLPPEQPSRRQRVGVSGKRRPSSRLVGGSGMGRNVQSDLRPGHNLDLKDLAVVVVGLHWIVVRAVVG